LTQPEQILDWLEDFHEQLHSYNGHGGRLLSCDVRQDPVIPADATDPAFGLSNSRYETIREEIYQRAPPYTANFQLDNTKEFKRINEAIGDHKQVNTLIKGYVASQNDCGAWMAMNNHYLGTGMLELEAINFAAEQKLVTLVYNGEKQNHFL
jgi:hypothetical protein